jgi:hypothetical protein
MATELGLEPVVKSTFAANDPEVMLPLVLVLWNTDTVFELRLATAKSGLPSPSKSPMATENGAVPVVKSTLVANDDGAILPKVLVFLKTEIVFEVLFTITISGLPSLSKSPNLTNIGTLETHMNNKNMLVMRDIVMSLINLIIW